MAKGTSGVKYNAIGCKFYVNESPIRFIQKKQRIATDMNVRLLRRSSVTSYMVCKNFLPFCRLPFVNCFFCNAEASELDVVPFVDFVFCCSYFRYHTPQIIAMTNIDELLPYVSA